MNRDCAGFYDKTKITRIPTSLMFIKFLSDFLSDREPTHIVCIKHCVLVRLGQWWPNFFSVGHDKKNFFYRGL